MICRVCEEDKDVNNINFIPNKQMKSGYLSRCRACQNKERKEIKTKYQYFYEIDTYAGVVHGKIKATSKKNAKRILKFRYPKGIILNLHIKKRIRNKA